MSQEKKTNKRKILIRYLILAACILVIAAVTVTTVFAVNDWFRSDVSIDSGNVQNPDDGKKPDDGNDDEDKKPDDDKPTNADTSFLCPVADLNVSNVFDFGKNISLGHYEFHTGVDMSAEVGTSVNACLDGTVENIVLNDELDGNTVTIKHDNGLTTVYSYIDVKSGLKKGDKIKRGDSIGTVAQPTGMEFKQDAHLHFEIIENGEQVDPAKYLDITEK